MIRKPAIFANFIHYVTADIYVLQGVTEVHWSHKQPLDSRRVCAEVHLTIYDFVDS